ncbi:MAG: diguanylate cyclase [Pseudomonadaceae bacterium]|jgi:diguanylate cyclase (GGDEF)-like protein|nr:diguanylate cyclase [Pseudomonadaceae bacterium]
MTALQGYEGADGPHSGAQPALLIVDDQPVILQALYAIFADDYEVFVASSGKQALAFCEVQLPDLILLDVSMPGMDGYETCQRLQANPLTTDIPVIFVTASTQHDDETRGLEAGAVDFISKPVNPSVVRARVRTHIKLKLQSDTLRRLSLTDGLTGVANRRQFDEALVNEWRRCSRSRLPLSLIFIDVDYFKRYNDGYGHQLGDDCLKAVAKVLKLGLKRPADLLARYGGEEFVCLLPETPLLGAQQTANALEAAVRALALPHAFSDAAAVLTISLGVTAAEPAEGESPAALLDAADKLLYQAKEAGRAQVKAGKL